jgi:entericidin B
MAAPDLEETIMTRTIITAITVGFALALAACNTMEGAGKDVKSAGTTLENAAK